MDIAETIKFRDICHMLEKLKRAENEAAKLKYLRRYYDSFLKHRARFRALMSIAQDDEETGSTSFYSILRCLIPRADRTREAYGLQVTMLAKVYIKVLQLSPDSPDAQRLYAKSYSGLRGDYADVVYRVLKPRCKSEPSNLNMKQVHSMLDAIASDDRRNTEKELTRLCEAASAREQTWFIRLLLKSMHLGLREHSVFALLHPQAREAYQCCSDLFRVCCMVANNKLVDEKSADAKEMDDGDSLLNVVQPFQHILPMLCEVFPGNIETLLSADVLYLETKMDGERFHLHYAQERFKYMSRNGVDYSYSFGADYNSGSLTPHLEDLLPVGVQSLILDGEMMVWDTRTKCFRVKAENTDVKHLRPAGSEGGGSWRPCFVVYDLLHLDGRSLLDLPYIKRSFKLQEILKEEQGVLHIMNPKKISCKEEFGRMFQAQLDANEEGVIVKKQNARYRPGVRNGGGWYKVKADYIAGLTTEFDLLVMGGFYNQNHSYIKSYLLGVLKYVSSREYYVYSVGKVMNVLVKRAGLNDALHEHWHDMVSEPPPSWYSYKDNLEGRPDVWIDPKQSAIVQIKATDLAPSSAFVLQKSMHFPRIQAWRNDKVWHECMSLDEFDAICKNTKGVLKITKRELRLEDFTTDRKRRKMTPSQARRMGALVYENKVSPSEIRRTSDILQGFSFCILSTKADSGYSIADLQRLVISSGGETVENPLPADPTCISIAGDITYRVDRLRNSGRHNIVSLSWLLDVCERQQMKLKPNDMVSMTDDLREEFRESFDAYGDSYIECVNLKDMKALLHNLDGNEEVIANPLSAKQILELEVELFGKQSPNYFRDTCAYFYGSREPSTNLARLTFQWRGGRVRTDVSNQVNELDEAVYVFVDVATADMRAFQLQLGKHIEIPYKIVDINWILDSEGAHQKLSVDQYLWESNGLPLQ